MVSSFCREDWHFGSLIFIFFLALFLWHVASVEVMVVQEQHQTLLWASERASPLRWPLLSPWRSHQEELEQLE